MAARKPAFRVTLDGRDLTASLQPRLMALTITESRGEDADQLDLTLDDADGKLALPRRGGIVTVSLGWAGGAMVDKGRFKVDEVEHRGAPDQITIRARSADFTSALRERRDKSWTDTTLGAILGDIASRNGLQLRIAPALSSRQIPHLAQSRESDANLLARLGRLYDAAATVKAGSLIFLPVGQGATASGGSLPGLTFTRKDGDQHTFKQVDRENFAGVSATYHDVSKGSRGTVQVGGSSGVSGQSGGRGTKRLRRVYASEAEARTAAEAEATRLTRGAAEMSYSLAEGRPELYPEQRVRISGIKPEIDRAAWLIKTATHTLDGNGGLTTGLELETG